MYGDGRCQAVSAVDCQKWRSEAGGGTNQGIESRPPIPDLRPLGRPLDPVFGDLAGDGVAMEPEHIGRDSEVAFRPLQRPRDEQLLELASRVVVMDALVEH